jgi:hypothetical protein
MRVSTIVAVGVLVAAPAIAECQAYVSAHVGLASAEWPIGTPLNGRIDDRALGYDYGNFDARGTPCAPGATCAPVVTDFGGNDITILKAALVPRFRVGQVWLFGTFGYYRATLEANLDLPDAKSRDRGALLGLGARWYFRDPWSVSIQATRFDDNLRQLMVGVGWGVGRERPDRAD